MKFISTLVVYGNALMLFNPCRYGSSIAELAVPEIMQRTVDKLESLHSEGVHVRYKDSLLYHMALFVNIPAETFSINRMTLFVNIPGHI